MSDTKKRRPDFRGAGPVSYNPDEFAARSALEQVQARHEARLLAVQGVTSIGIGLGPAGGEAIVVGVVDAGVARLLPSEIEGVPVMVTVTGPIDALRRRVTDD